MSGWGRLGKLTCWDLESEDWDQPLSTAALTEDGDEIYFTGPDCLRQMGREMEKIGGSWCAHYGGGYDVPLLMEHGGGYPRLDKLILSGTTILTGESNGLRLRDTWPLTLAPLAKIGKWVGLKKLDYDRSQLEQLSARELREYNMRDCEILLLGVQEIQAYLKEIGARNSWTAGSAAVSILRALEPDAWEVLERTRASPAPLMGALSGIRGGRVETWARGEVPRVWSYDFKSSYPARYKDEDLGIGLRRATPRDRVGLFRCRWYWPWRDKRPPALDDATGAGAGYCEGWISGEERDAFEERGVIPKMLEGWAPLDMIPLGQTFCRELYAQKEANSPYAKVFLNSLHGKFGEGLIKDSFTRDQPMDGEWWAPAGPPTLRGDWWHWSNLGLKQDGLAAPHVQPIAGGQILARARVALYRVLWTLEEDGWEVYYVDTDSVHTNAPPDRVAQLIGLGMELGDLAVEAGPCRGYYVGPKAYLLVDDSTGEVVKSALKGAPLKTLKNGVRATQPTGLPFYRAARRAYGDQKAETGEDLRLRFFQEVLSNPFGMSLQKEGVSSFRQGRARGGVWGKQQLTRHFKPTGRGKTFPDSRFPAAWHYLTPSECNRPQPRSYPTYDESAPYQGELDF